MGGGRDESRSCFLVTAGRPLRFSRDLTGSAVLAGVALLPSDRHPPLSGHIPGTSHRDLPRIDENRRDLRRRSDRMRRMSAMVRETPAQDPAYRPTHLRQLPGCISHRPYVGGRLDRFLWCSRRSPHRRSGRSSSRRCSSSRRSQDAERLPWSAPSAAPTLPFQRSALVFRRSVLSSSPQRSESGSVDPHDVNGRSGDRHDLWYERPGLPDPHPPHNLEARLENCVRQRRCDVIMTRVEMQIAALIERSVDLPRCLAEDKVARYAQTLDLAPPVTVLMLYDGSLLIDGYHRIEAAKRLGRTVIRAEFRQASCKDELHFAIDLPPHRSLRQNKWLTFKLALLAKNAAQADFTSYHRRPPAIASHLNFE